MTIDRFPLWVAMSLLGFSPVCEAQEAAPLPPAPARPSVVVSDSTRAAIDWAQECDLAIFDFEQVPSVLKDMPLTKAEKKFDVSAKSKNEAKSDREIQHYARLFRIWTFESFQHDSQEYRRRMTAAQNILRVWEYEGCSDDLRVELKNWFHQAALASAAGKSLPECDFLNQDYLDQVAKGIALAPRGGPRAGVAFVRSLFRGAFELSARHSLIGSALSSPIPFAMPDPEVLVGTPGAPEAGVVASESVPELEMTSEEPLAQQEPATEPKAEPAKSIEGPAQPVVTP